MVKITFMGAGSTIFARNVLGDCMCSEALSKSQIALYDINERRLLESASILAAINKGLGGKAVIKTYLGEANRKEALRGADFVVNAIQQGGYDPCTITDFEIPKKYGLRQTIADTLGIGGIMRSLRTIPVLEDFSNDALSVCPDTYFLNYTNPMGILTGYLQQHTQMKTIGLCHSVQICVPVLFEKLGMTDYLDGHKELIAGINHMAWLLEIQDKNGTDLYPIIREKAAEKNRTQKHSDMVRFDYIDKFGFYCTESSEHNAEYNPFYIKSKYPELIEQFNIPLDEYPRRCIEQIKGWEEEYHSISANDTISHKRSHEYASYIMEAMVSNKPYLIGGNVLNSAGFIENLPKDACVEVPCTIYNRGIAPHSIGRLPVQLAAMNSTNVNVQLLTIEAGATRKKEHIYHAAMLDPHTAAELSIEKIIQMVDELIAAHGKWLPAFH